jgi:hypothetical protein
MKAIKDSDAVVKALGAWDPGDLAWIERLEWRGDAQGGSCLLLDGLFQRRTSFDAGWPSASSPTFRIRLVFDRVHDLRLRSFGGVTQVMGFSIDDISDRAWEGLCFQVSDYEGDKIAFQCAAIRVDAVEKAAPPELPAFST